MRIQNRPIKTTDRALFLALQADCKDYPGGIRALADSMGLNPTTLANTLNPDNEASPPSMAALIEIIKVAQAKRAAFYIAQMVGQVTVDMEIEPKPRSQAIGAFMELMHSVGDVIGKGSEFAKDNDFDAVERRTLEPLLIGLMKATAEMLQSIRS